ncbi:MAG: type IX secretion system membrane protein PorP/SprF [Bacteroidota bacterium]
MKMNVKNIITLGLGAIALLVSERATAQQDPLFTQYLQNPLTVNPAYAGSTDALTVVALSRIQWTGIPGAPRTNNLSIHSPIQDRNIGVGLNVINDNVGPVSQTGFFGDVSYKLQIGTNSTLRLGLRAGGAVFAAKLGTLQLNDQSDIAFSQNIGGKFLPNVGFGAYFSTNKIFVGFSAPRLLANEVSFDNNVVTERAYRESRHVFLTAGGLFKVSPSVNFKPSLGLRYVGGAPVSVDVQTNFQFSEKFWLGAMYRFQDAVGGIFQLQVNDQFRFGYSYDFNTSALRKYNGGTHEIMLTYDFIYRRANIKSPRYF